MNSWAEPATLIGSAGVGLLLIAFVVNAAGRVRARDPRYLVLNAAGAALACWASVLLDFVPFVVLEATWCAAALAGLIGSRRRSADRG
jgi:hypothetical protein